MSVGVFTYKYIYIYAGASNSIARCGTLRYSQLIGLSVIHVNLYVCIYTIHVYLCVCVFMSVRRTCHTYVQRTQRSMQSAGAINYNTLQHIATHCNTLQQAATHCNT